VSPTARTISTPPLDQRHHDRRLLQGAIGGSRHDAIHSPRAGVRLSARRTDSRSPPTPRLDDGCIAKLHHRCRLRTRTRPPYDGWRHPTTPAAISPRRPDRRASLRAELMVITRVTTVMMTSERAVDSSGNHAKRIIGERLESVKRLDYDWDLRFDAGSSLMFQSVWRLVSDARIEVTSKDDSQQFGLKIPIDAAAELKAKIGDERVSDVRIDGVTSDLTLYFGQHLRLEVVSTSSGYEAWSLHAKEVQIIGRNGDTVVFSSPKSP
jgi:hypothetical protein